MSYDIFDASRRPWVLAGLAVLAFCLTFGSARDASAHHLVKAHNLTCSETFPCPEELRRRVDFWVQVFNTWETDEMVFHDSRRPERVYRVVKSTAGCSARSSSSPAKRERRKLREQLNALAKKIDRGKTNWTERELHLVALFPSRKASHLRSAAKHIRCQQGNANRFAKAVKRYGRYRSIVQPILKQEGLPSDIQYLPFVESAYNPDAYSRVGAAGLWQIMPRTGRSLGLKLNAIMDERLDPEAATRAAAQYLKNANKRLMAEARKHDKGITGGELNPFVITSYNYGVSGMTRAIRSVGTDFVDVLNKYKSRSFQTAVKNFYASFLAARHVAKNAERYFGKLALDAPLRHDTVTLKVPTSLSRVREVFGVDEEELRPLNPALTRYVWHEWRYLPKGYRLHLPDRKDNWKSARATLASLAPEDANVGGTRYRVKRGDTACGVAHAFHVGCRSLIAANNLGSRAVIRAGQELIIPPSRGVADLLTGGASSRKVSNRAKARRYKVRKGDTACVIARRHGVGCKQLIRYNKLGKRGVIRVGQVLRIPGKSATKTLAIPTQVKVRKGDTPCGIASRYGVDCSVLLATNGLNRKSLIRIGQSLKMPQPEKAAEKVATKDADTKPSILSIVDDSSTPQAENAPAPELPDTPAAEVAVVSGDTRGDKRTAPLDNDLDVRAKAVKRKGKLAWQIEVLPEETLGHYADWLGLPSAQTVRRLNGLSRSKSIRAGHKVYLPIATDVEKEEFEFRRADYHRVLVEQFKEHYQIERLSDYRIVSGDSAWKVASAHELPLWVVLRYNPELRRRAPKIGEVLAIPVIDPVRESDEPPVPLPGVDTPSVDQG